MNKVKLLSGFGLALAFSQVWAGAITDINVETISASERVVRITFDGQAPKPSSFSTANPPRVALDFPATSVKMTQTQVKSSDAVVKLATAVESNGRARVLLNLAENANYSTEIQGNTILVRVGGKSADVAYNTTPKEVVTNTPAVNQGRSFTAAKPTAIDFRRTENGAGKLEVVLPTKDVPTDVSRVGDKVIVTLLGSQVPSNLLRKYDVNDFATPAKKVDIYNEGRNGKIVISAKGDWTFFSSQTPDKLVVEVTEKTKNPYAKSVLGQDKFTGNKLSLNFQDVEVRTVLQVIAEFTKLNIVVSDKVGGNMTLRLTDVPWDQALDLILQTKELTQHKDGNVIRIETADEYNSRVQKMDQVQNNGELVQRVFKLKYKNVESLKDVLNIGGDSKNAKGSLLSNRGVAYVDPDNNMLIIKDVRPVIQSIEHLLDELDIAKKQVLIEARIVEAKEDFSREFGARFGAYRSGSRTSMDGNFTNALENNYVGKNNKEGGEFKHTPSVDLPISASTGVMGIFHSWSSYAIGLELSASQITSDSRIVSSPKILTADREEGSIEEGYDIPYQEASSSGATSVSFKRATTGLKVTPQITPDGNVIMELEITKDTVSTSVAGSEPALEVKQIKTKATVENGGTVVVGGIYVQEQTNSVTKVPFLGDIPILGNLFKTRGKKDNRRELLVFITPHILADIDDQARYR